MRSAPGGLVGLPQLKVGQNVSNPMAFRISPPLAKPVSCAIIQQDMVIQFELLENYNIQKYWLQYFGSNRTD